MTMDFSTPSPLLTLKRGLSIRPLLHADAEVQAGYCNNVKITRNMMNTWPLPYTIDSSHHWIARARDTKDWRAVHTISDPAAIPAESIQHLPDGTLAPCHWVIALNGHSIGALGLKFKTDVAERSADLGYWIGEQHWGKGFTTEAVGAMIAWAWQAYPELDRIEAGVYAWNSSSTNVLRKLGFVEEGRLRAAVFKMGKRCDLIIFGQIRPGLEITTTAPSEIEAKPDERGQSSHV